MFSSLLSSHFRPAGRVLSGLTLALLALGLVAGCGGGDQEAEKASKPVVTLAKVGDQEIKSDYYELKLAKMAPNDLPADSQGKPYDTATQEGKLEFLQVLINKELMSQKGLQLGYDKDASITQAYQALLSYEAGLALWENVVDNPSKTISEEELQSFYDQMGITRVCRYIICNFEDDAEKAREFALSGADWDDVVDQFHDGDKDPQARYEINVPFGQYGTDFQDVVWATEAGGVSQPVNTTYGWWVLRVEEIKEGRQKPPLEQAKAHILDVTYGRKVNRIRNDFKKEVHKRHSLVINETTLWTCYNAMPDESLMDPETGQPRERDTLVPLDIKPVDWNLPFYSYTLAGEHHSATLGDYKAHYDKMSVFQRPKKGELMGGLRQKIINELERGFMDDEARSRGFYEDPDAVAKVEDKIEEMIVTKLYGDVVKYDEQVNKDQMVEFWSEHGNEYVRPATRDGRMVVCASEAQAQAAIKAIEAGTRWKKILTEFGNDQENKSRSGRMEDVPHNPDNPVSAALFSLEAGKPSAPIPLADGQFVVLIFEMETAGRNMEMDEVRDELASRIKNLRQEEAFQVLLTKWTAEFGVTIFEDQLVHVDSIEELLTVATPENVVPRSSGTVN